MYGNWNGQVKDILRHVWFSLCHKSTAQVFFSLPCTWDWWGKKEQWIPPASFSYQIYTRVFILPIPTDYVYFVSYLRARVVYERKSTGLTITNINQYYEFEPRNEYRTHDHYYQSILWVRAPQLPLCQWVRYLISLNLLRWPEHLGPASCGNYYNRSADGTCTWPLANRPRCPGVSVDIKCLSITPFCTPILHPYPLFFLSPHPMTPLYPLSYQILHTNCKF